MGRVQHQAAGRLLEAQRLAEDQAVFGGMLGRRLAEGRRHDRQAPPDQPARQAVQDDEQRAVGKQPRGRAPVDQGQRGLAAVHVQLARHVVQHQREEAQRPLQRVVQVPGIEHGVGEDGEAARRMGCASMPKNSSPSSAASTCHSAPYCCGDTRASGMPSSSALKPARAVSAATSSPRRFASARASATKLIEIVPLFIGSAGRRRCGKSRHSF
jgi:hypothetical protein